MTHEPTLVKALKDKECVQILLPSFPYPIAIHNHIYKKNQFGWEDVQIYFFLFPRWMCKFFYHLIFYKMFETRQIRPSQIIRSSTLAYFPGSLQTTKTINNNYHSFQVIFNYHYRWSHNSQSSKFKVCRKYLKGIYRYLDH